MRLKTCIAFSVFLITAVYGQEEEEDQSIYESKFFQIAISMLNLKLTLKLQQLHHAPAQTFNCNAHLALKMKSASTLIAVDVKALVYPLVNQRIVELLV